MRTPLLGLLATLLLPLGLMLAPPAAAASATDTATDTAAAPAGELAAAPVHIMPLGDSITGSPGCWRAVLWNQLQNAGHTDIDFVGTLGTQGCGQDHDGDNEGHGGELVTNVADQNLLPARLAATLPDIVVMHFGTNDVWSSIAPDRVLAAYTKLVGQMRASNPAMRILVAQLIPMNPASCPGCAQRVVDFNARIPDWARATSTSDSPVTVVDQWTGFSTAADTYDGVHPNAAGDDKIAARWYPALSAVLDAGIPDDPGDPDDGTTAACAIGYRVTNEWSGGFQGEIVVRNTGTSAINGWTLRWTFPGGQRVSSLWGGTATQSGADVGVTSASYTADIPAAGSATIGFTATRGTTNPAPAAFTLNGATCASA